MPRSSVRAVDSTLHHLRPVQSVFQRTDIPSCCAVSLRRFSFRRLYDGGRVGCVRVRQIPISPWYVVVFDDKGLSFIRMFVLSLMFSAGFWWGLFSAVRAI